MLIESSRNILTERLGRLRPSAPLNYRALQTIFPRIPTSLPFLPVLEAFPQIGSNVTAEQFYVAVNEVKPSLIRVEADEVTYPLHIVLRTELERGLIEGNGYGPGDLDNILPRYHSRRGLTKIMERAHGKVPRSRPANRCGRCPPGRPLGNGRFRLLSNLLARSHLCQVSGSFSLEAKGILANSLLKPRRNCLSFTSQLKLETLFH